VLIFDDELGAGFEAGEFDEGIEIQPYIGTGDGGKLYYRFQRQAKKTFSFTFAGLP